MLLLVRRAQLIELPFRYSTVFVELWNHL